MKTLYTLLAALAITTFSNAAGAVRPTLAVSPLWVNSDYGWYWGGSLFGGVVINKHHTLRASADYAPWGGVYITDVDVNGAELHIGGTLSYNYSFCLGRDFLKISPGACAGITSIPYIYGSWGFYGHGEPVDRSPKPERETIIGGGPDLKISLGRRKTEVFAEGRVLFVEHNSALLTNLGVSYTFGKIDTSRWAAESARKAERAADREERRAIPIQRRTAAPYFSIGGNTSVGTFDSKIPQISSVLPFWGFEWDLGIDWKQAHLLYGNFTASYSGDNDLFGGGIGYLHTLLETEKVSLRAGGTVGLWVLYTSWGGTFETNYEFANQEIPYFGGPQIRFEAGRLAPRFFLKEQLMIGAGVFNTVSAGIAFDFSRKAGQRSQPISK